MLEKQEKSYRIRRVSEGFDWSDIACAPIDVYCWCYDYHPRAFAQVVLLENQQLRVKMTCYEKNPKADYRQDGEDVYKDSCLEFFASFSSDDLYINCEMNAAGASLMSLGRFDGERRPLSEVLGHMPQVLAEVLPECWSVELRLDVEDIAKMFPGVRLAPGFCFTGNFFKCGDETEFEHYGMWCRSIAVIPQFHRPQYFGELIIE